MQFERRWIRADEAAERLGLSKKTVLNRISSGRLPASHPPGLGVRIDWKAIEALYEQARRTVGKK